jgi:putative endonuclease
MPFNSIEASGVYSAEAEAVAPEHKRRRTDHQFMKFVYILESLTGEHFYTGLTDDVDARLSKHNAGAVTHIAKYRPLKIKKYVAFTDEARAIAFEKYLKSGSGRAFAKTRL